MRNRRQSQYPPTRQGVVQQLIRRNRRVSSHINNRSFSSTLSSYRPLADSPALGIRNCDLGIQNTGDPSGMRYLTLARRPCRRFSRRVPLPESFLLLTADSRFFSLFAGGTKPSICRPSWASNWAATTPTLPPVGLVSLLAYPMLSIRIERLGVASPSCGYYRGRLVYSDIARRDSGCWRSLVQTLKIIRRPHPTFGVSSY